MKDDEVPYAGLSGHDAGLPRGEMIPFSCLIGIAVEVRRFTVEHISAMGQFYDFYFIFVIVTGIDDICEFLAARDRDKLIFHVAQSKDAFLFSVFEVQRGGKREIVRLPLPDVLLQLLEP